jgi:HPt (histidine-containing phosphotransfer) domain-containing protein
MGGRAPVDHAHLARYTFGNRALEIEVLTLFADQAPSYLDALRTAPTEKAWREAAHTLKGSARAVGAVFVADAAERAEVLGFAAEAGARAAIANELYDCLAEARAHIAGLKADG